MSEIVRTSFYYDPIRQGYDTNSWRTLSGSPAVVSGRLVVDGGVGIAGEIIHYADFLKGDISFNVNVPSTPAAGDSRLFGVSAPNTVAYIRFSIDDTLTCQTSDGTTTTESASLPWNATLWNGVNVEFRIRWEAGSAKFFINGTQVHAVSDASVPHGVLSLYMFDNSASAMTVGDINVRGTQSFVMTVKTSDTATSTSTSGTLSRFESITITENVSLFQPSLSMPYVGGGMSESVVITENTSVIIAVTNVINDTVTVTENVALVRI